MASRARLMMPERDLGEENLPWEEVEARIRCAVLQLQAADHFLLEVDANERTITHRLATYLEPHFPGWHVDVEYNRVGSRGHPKRIVDWEQIDPGRIAATADVSELVRDTEGRTVFPDIIVHRRGDPDANLLVLEVKKSGRSGDVDRWKLRVMRDEAGLNYDHAAFLQLPVGDNREEALVVEPIEADPGSP